MKFEKFSTYNPSLYELADLFNEKLKIYFDEVEVGVIDCPDLSLKPFCLAAKGLSSNDLKNNKVFDVGGESYMIPIPQLERPEYDSVEIAKKSGFTNQAFLIGAACGPFKTIGFNNELVPNLFYNTLSNDEIRLNNQTKSIFFPKKENIDEQNDFVVQKCPNTQFNMLGNFFACEGAQGKVLHVKVKRRKNNEFANIEINGNLISIMRNTLEEKYSLGRTVSMGGAFIYKGGSAYLHIMPDFSKTPINNVKEAKKWLKFINIKDPLLCLTVFHSHDAFNLNLRLEHTHCYGLHDSKSGGHFHFEFDAEKAEYEGYFNIANELVRVDQTPNKLWS